MYYNLNGKQGMTMPTGVQPMYPQGGYTAPYPNVPAGNMPVGTGVVSPPMPSGAAIPGVPAGAGAGAGAFEESYIENILRMNLGKVATIYMTFENNTEWNAKIFKGRLEAAGRDHIIISDTQTGMRYLLLMVNLDYITFDEPLNYSYPFSS